MRRANGTGSIARLSGNRRRPYVVRICERDEWGRYYQRPLSYHATAREAQEALDAYNAQRAAGLAPAPDKLSLTVGDIYARWSEREYPRMGESNMRSMRAAWGRASALADRRIRDVGLDDLQGIIDRAASAGASQSTLDKTLVLIHALWRYAAQRDIVGKDYSQYIETPKVAPKFAKGVLSDTQIAQIARMARDGEPWADTVLILIYTGFRIGELLALTPMQADLAAGYLRGGSKTDAGRNRIVPIHAVIRPYIAARARQRHSTLIARDDGSAVPQGWYRSRPFRALMQRIGAPDATPHWCRHTCATRMHAAGMDPLVIKWILGHSTEQDITAHYTHETIGVIMREYAKLA